MKKRSCKEEKTLDRREKILEEAKARIAAASIELDVFDLQLLRRVTNAGLASQEASAMLRTDLQAIKADLGRWIEKTKLGDSGAKNLGITVSDIEALTLRDALESALADVSALRAYDNELSREGDAGRGGFVVGRATFEAILNRFTPQEDRASLIPSATVFQSKLTEILAVASDLGLVAVEINAEKLYGLVVKSPISTRIPMCCRAMLMAMLPGDRVISQPLTADHAWLTIRYKLSKRR